MTLLSSLFSISCMLREVPSTLYIFDRNINRKYIRHALSLVFDVMNVYVLLTPFITFVSQVKSISNLKLDFVML